MEDTKNPCTDNEESHAEFSEVIEEKEIVVVGEGTGNDCEIGNIKSDMEEVGSNRAKSLIEVKSTYFVEETEDVEHKTLSPESKKILHKIVDPDPSEGCRKRRLSNAALTSHKLETNSEFEDSVESVLGDTKNTIDNDKSSCIKRFKMRTKVINIDLRRKFENNRKGVESSSDEEKEIMKKEPSLPVDENNQCVDEEGT